MEVSKEATSPLRSEEKLGIWSRWCCLSASPRQNDDWMAESSSERQKEEENDGGATHTDRISSLPDSVLCHILSFLSTETCVRTMSLVSRRWLHLWKHLEVLDFYDGRHKLDAAEQVELFEDFVIFVNIVLARRRSRDIRKMRLSCSYFPADRFSAKSVNSWIRTAVGPRLEELHLALFSYDEYSPRLLLTILSTCTNLVSLSLCGGEISVAILPRSSVIHLPSLKMLQLEIGYVDATHVDILLSGCPILETLELSFSPPSLATLRMPPSLKSLKFTVEDDVGAYLEIDAPALKYLSLTKITFGDALRNLDKVDEAYLDVFLPPGESASYDPLLNLLRALSRVKHLVLSCSTTKWLLDPPVIDFPEFQLLLDAPIKDFPELCHLLHLELILPIFNPGFLFHVLQQCPMLQALIIQDDKDPSSYSCRPGVQPESVPNCLISHLTFIHFKGYEEHYHQREVAGYVLRNGLVLKTMLISGLSLDLKEKWEKYRILKQFSDIPRGSAICQLKFD